MADFQLVDPRGWECDLQSVYAAYMGHFQLYNIPWHERSWGIFFESFEAFLTFQWPVITVTDCYTGRAHIVIRKGSIGAFIKMVKTRFGETLPTVDNILYVSPFETGQRHLRTISDYSGYKKLHATLPAAVLAALKVRVRNGEPRAIQEIWEARDKTFLAIDFEWSERNNSTCLEWGYAAVRCGHLEALGTWPPDPESHYRRGHYIVAEYVDRVQNKYCPNFPWAYAYGDSQVVPRAKLSQVIQATISSMLSPDSETVANSLVLVAHGISGDLKRLEEMKIKIPHNVLTIDTALYEKKLFSIGQRGAMQDPSGRPRDPNTLLSLSNLLKSLGVDIQCALHNSGNDAMMVLLALQLLLDPANTRVPLPKGANGRMMNRSPSWSPGGVPSIAFMPTPPIGQLGMMANYSPSMHTRGSPDQSPDQEFGVGSNKGLGFLSLNDNSRRSSSLSSPYEGRSRSRVNSGGSTHDLVNRMSGLAVKNGPYTP
ncbi:hypothetical protein CERSUDRAFT_110792 [Gelatoporia subvermispora B]|uniref:Gfd2/YDR514C-like C-terminal domain-containing protein n=1 Tax=Ceriporiopsis subvermispora (strain B) TaxID=914234 RepID=M2RTI4_CERS8|nr:hypothetical protein CERSUDRAFT_110792 [Gelatoporia subvermispora B]